MTLALVGCEDDLATGNSGSINGHDYVDLGLPSGKKWATCNVGANSPEKKGNYYAWGEITTKSEYTKDNSLTYMKNFSDISGNPNYDVARAKWGGSWRMPTKEEMKELVQNCIWKWITQNNADGYKVIGSNGNSIFLPAAGCCTSTPRYVSERGYYWSSSPVPFTVGSDNYDAYHLSFTSDGRGVYEGDAMRYIGRTVRPISD